MVNTRTRGDFAAKARQYAYAYAVYANSPGAPAMRPRNRSGDGTVEDAGTYETHGERNLLSPVAAAIASADPASGMSGETV